MFSLIAPISIGARAFVRRRLALSDFVSNFTTYIGVRGYPYGIFSPCARWLGGGAGWECSAVAAVAVVVVAPPPPEN